MFVRAWLLSAFCLSIVSVGCGESASAPPPPFGGAGGDNAGGQAEDASAPSEDGATLSKDAPYVRGRVTDATGKPVADVEVRADKSVARTDAQGRFELRVDGVDEDKEIGVSVEGDKYSNGIVPVSVAKDGEANVELTVKERKTVMLAESKDGGRLEGDDGFAIEVPPGALKDSKGAEVQGEVEIRYALVSQPADVAAAPGRMQSKEQVSLEGYGMVDVVFYKGGERLTLTKAASYEIPLVADSGLAEGSELAAYQLAGEDKRWQKGAGAMVKAGKIVVQSSSAGWVGAASELAIDSCVSGRLKSSADAAAPNTIIRAARARGLSLVQAETAPDGSFCLPVTPNDDWNVSAYFADSKAESRGIQVSVTSTDAVGMCGGTGCKQVGDVELPVLEL